MNARILPILIIIQMDWVVDWSELQKYLSCQSSSHLSCSNVVNKGIEL